MHCNFFRGSTSKMSDTNNDDDMNSDQSGLNVQTLPINTLSVLPQSFSDDSGLIINGRYTQSSVFMKTFYDYNYKPGIQPFIKILRKIQYPDCQITCKAWNCG